MTDIDEVSNVADPTFEEDIQPEEGASLWIKRGWIMLQATMMTIYMIIGLRAYFRIQDGWCKTKSLFVFQTIIILYLLVNEFTGHQIQGIFLILLFTQYSLFLTFSIVVDSMITDKQDKNIRDNKLRIFSKVFRSFIHISSLALFVSTFFMKNCYSIIYPRNFIALVIIILTHQVYDLYIYTQDYMIDWENIPFKSYNQLRYNKELFLKQSKVLLIGNLVFGAISMTTVILGYTILNQSAAEKIEDGVTHVQCFNGNEWIFNSLTGNIFGMMHQLLILMQINITQYVLVRIPRNLGIFDPKVDLFNLMSTGLRDRLLVQGEQQEEEDRNDDDKTCDDDQAKGPKTALGKLLLKIRESRMKYSDTFKV